jgi:hypothetical protein
MNADFATDGKTILDYLKSWPTQFISGREIARRVGGKKRYAEDRFWAVPVLKHLVEEEKLESDSMGHYRLMPVDKKKTKLKTKRHVSPQILKILKSSGKQFDGVNVYELEEPEEPVIKPYPFAKNKGTPSD